MNQKAHTAHMPDIQRDTARFYRTMSAPALVLLTFLFLIPVGIILSKAFITEGGQFSTERLITLIRDPYILRVLRFTVLQASVSTLVSVLIALPGAYLLANFQFRGKSIIRAICTIPFVLPSILVVLGFVIFYGNQGIINTAFVKLFHLSEPPVKILYSFKAVILAHAFYNFPIALGLISSFWEQLPVRYDQAAMVMGARKWTVFRTVTLPRLIPAIISAATLIFLFCFSSFVILLVLGGGPQFTTLEVEIYRRARMTLDIEGAAALSLLSIGFTILLVALHLWSQRLLSHQEEIEQIDERRRGRTPTSPLATISSILYLVLSVIFVLGPLVGIVYRSFQAPVSRSQEMVFSFVWYRQLFGFDRAIGSPLGIAASALVTSIVIAAIATVISLFVGTLLAARLRSKEAGKGASIELYAMLPMAVSSVVIGLGYYLISSTVSHSTMVSRTLIVLAHTVIASPFVLRSILPEYRKIPRSYTQAALTLGATVPQTFSSIDLPLLRPALATGGAFAFALSMGEINATLILSDSSVVTVPIIMYRLIGSYNYAGACALGTILILCCAIVFATIERVRRSSSHA
jgi:thiamine transport system permease protein